jgi:hypothetical protein
MKLKNPYTYKTLKGLLNAIESKYISAEWMQSKRAYFHKYGWLEFKVTPEVEEEFWNGIAKVVWSRNAEQKSKKLRKATGFFMRGLMYNKHGFSYCVNQDYVSEMNIIHRTVNSL